MNVDRGEAETFISLKCFQSMMKHMKRVFYMASQTHRQTGVQVFVINCGTH